MAIQTLSRLTVIPPSEFVAAIGSTVVTRLVVASIRTNDSPLSPSHNGIHTLAKPNAAPEQGTPWTGIRAVIALVVASIRTNDSPLSPSHNGIHTLAKPNAAPEQGTPWTGIRAVIALVVASIRSTSFKLMFAIHIEPTPVAIQSGPPPVTIVVRGRSVTAGSGKFKSWAVEARASKPFTDIQNAPSAVCANSAGIRFVSGRSKCRR